MLWNQFCVLRLSVVYRGRAIPVIWRVVEQGSSRVQFCLVPIMSRARHRDALLDDAGHCDFPSETLRERCRRKTALGGCSHRSGDELSKNRLAMGQILCPQRLWEMGFDGILQNQIPISNRSQEKLSLIQSIEILSISENNLVK
jgi:hypothetical protein